MIKIIPAVSDDALKISQLAQEIWPICYANILSTEQIAFMLNDIYAVDSILHQIKNGDRFLLAVEDQKVYGFASYSKKDSQNLIRINKLYILPTVQGKGIGRLIISFIENAAFKQGFTVLELNVNRNNPAKDFYLNLGFQVYKSVDINYHQFILDDYVMRKSVIGK